MQWTWSNDRSRYLKMQGHEVRPDVDENIVSDEFARWYWPVTHLKEFCERLKIPSSGTKAQLRARIIFALDHPGTVPPKAHGQKPRDNFAWATAELTPDTIITLGVSFGPNVRSFFKQEIGNKFVCHSDFMDWVKSNIGATLGDAAAAWRILDDRKLDPSFRREIAECNNYLRYLRDIRDRNKNLSLDDAIYCWDQKKIRPAKDGIVVYEQADLNFLEQRGGQN